MTGDGISTRMQKEIGQIQGELSHMQLELSQWDTRLDTKLKDLQAEIKSEVRSELRSKLRSELHSLFEQYLGPQQPSVVGNASTSRGKGVLGTPPGFPPQEQLLVSPRADLGHSSLLPRGMTMDLDRSSF